MGIRKHGSYFTRAEVAQMFEVAPNTVTRWAREGKLPCVQTPGGRRRYPRQITRELVRKFRGAI